MGLFKKRYKHEQSSANEQPSSNYNQLNHLDRPEDSVPPSKRQQDKLTKFINTGDEGIFSIPEAQVTFADRNRAIAKLKDDQYIQTTLKSSLKKIRAPINSRNAQQIYATIAGNYLQEHILASMTGADAKNPHIDSNHIAKFINNFETPIDFDAYSEAFLSDIYKNSHPTEYNKYSIAMAEFKEKIYGKQQEYWDQAKLMREKGNSPEVFLEHTIIDGDPYSFYNESYTLTPEILQQAGLEPRHNIILGDKHIGISGAYKAHGYDVAMAYVEGQDGELHARSYYRSGSAGLWRYLPDYVADETGYPTWFGKAYKEESLTLPFDLQYKLNDIAKNDRIDTNNVDPNLLFFGTAYKYSSISDYKDLLEERQLKGDFYREIRDESKHSFGELRKKKTPPESLQISHYDAPNFQTKIASTTLESKYYHNGLVELYPSYNQELFFSMCSIHKNGSTQAWIGNIETASPITSTGCHAEWVSMGDFGTPLYEYNRQADGYGDPTDTKGNYENMWRNYLSKIPLIRRYLHETHKA